MRAYLTMPKARTCWRLVLFLADNPRKLSTCSNRSSRNLPTQPRFIFLELHMRAPVRVDAGKQVFARLLASDSSHAQASYILGQGYYDSKLFDEAAQSFQDVLKADPTFPGAHRELGKVYVSMRKNTEAEKELRMAVEQDPKDAVSVYFLGGLLVQSERYTDGVPFLERARNLDPDSWATYLYLGKAKLKLQDNAGAVRYLQQAAEMNHDEASVFYLLANALHASGREEEAREARRRVAELHTSSLEVDRKMHDAMVAGAR
jgi:predicted Zn-dependent protease